MTSPKNPLRTTTRSPPKSLRLTPYAWAKLLFLRDAGETEVGGFAISAAKNLLLIEDLCLVQQRCTPVSVKFDDASVADYFDARVDEKLPPERFARIWVHTHPGESPRPSSTDEETFARCFGGADWSVMFIVAQWGQTYARLHFRAGPGGDVELPVEIDFSQPFLASQWGAWQEEYIRHVAEDLGNFRPAPRPTSGTGTSGTRDRDLAEEFFGPFGPALFPDELGPFDPFLEDLDDLSGPFPEADRLGAAICA